MIAELGRWEGLKPCHLVGFFLHLRSSADFVLFQHLWLSRQQVSQHLPNSIGAAQDASPRQKRLGAGSGRSLSTRTSIEASALRLRQMALAGSRDAKVSSTALSLCGSRDTSGRNARCDLPLQIVK